MAASLSPVCLPHSPLAGPATIKVDRNIRVDPIKSVLPCDREQDAGGDEIRVGEPRLEHGINCCGGVLGTLSHHWLLPASGAVEIDGEIGKDSGSTILARYWDQNASGTYDSFRKLKLDGRLDPDNMQATGSILLVEAIKWMHIHRMPVGTPGELMEARKLQAIAKAFFIIQDVFDDQPAIHNVTRVGVYALFMSGEMIGVEHTSADPERAQVFPRFEAFSPGQ